MIPLTNALIHCPNILKRNNREQSTYEVHRLRKQPIAAKSSALTADLSCQSAARPRRWLAGWAVINKLIGRLEKHLKLIDVENNQYLPNCQHRQLTWAASQRPDPAGDWQANRSVFLTRRQTLVVAVCLFFSLLVVYRRYRTQKGVGFKASCKNNSRTSFNPRPGMGFRITRPCRICPPCHLSSYES